MSELDPVLRCDSCQALVTVESIHKLGVCNKCGNKRLRNVQTFSEEERAQIEEWGYTKFLELFEAQDE